LFLRKFGIRFFDPPISSKKYPRLAEFLLHFSVCG